MFVIYEHVHAAVPAPGTPLGTQTVLYSEIVLSSDGRGDKIDWKKLNERPQAEIITQLLRQVSPDKREYDATTHIWTFMNAFGVNAITVLNQAIQNGILPSTQLKSVKDLRGLHARKDFSYVPPPRPSPFKSRSPVEVEIKFDASTFFHAPPPPPKGAGLPTGEALYSALASLLHVDVTFIKTAPKEEQKKVYRRAALSYHPDRPDGDASKMSELNTLWAAFNA
jgi:hypothetical protein